MGFFRLCCLLIFSLATLASIGCAQKFSTTSNSSVSAMAETDYCGTSVSFSGGTTITATAQYQRFDDGTSGLSTTSVRPIRFAEVHVFTADGTRVNCTETDASGKISVMVPAGSGRYTMRVNSRANNASVKASILNNPSSNSFYSITSSVFDVSGQVSTMPITVPTASHQGTLEGGAFNILDQIYQANLYIRTNNSSGFTVAPKIQVYWTPGFSPGTYYDQPTSSISFYVSQYNTSLTRGLYILGGNSGSLCTDTDHFDNSVILHEYAHFLEDAYNKSSSPGGSHNGNKVIDPRLAWSEGWANFFQAAALGRTFYRDTTANADCSGGAMLSFSDFSMETKSTDIPTNLGEGVFREISISRALYDSMTGSSQDTDSFYATLGFSPIWKGFATSSGITASSKYKNSGLFFKGVSAIVTSDLPAQATPFSAALNNEKQMIDETYYGLTLTPQAGATCTFSFGAGEPVAESTSTGLYVRMNNRYFKYTYDGSATRAIVNLRYQGTATPYDLDLIAYKEDYVLGDTSTMVATSIRTYPETGASGWPGYEQINLSGQAAGVYLINVRVFYLGARTATTFYLENSNGDRICP